VFYAKRDGEFKVNLQTVLALDFREENLLNTFDRILGVRDGIEDNSAGETGGGIALGRRFVE